jgi:uncharacterized repeat protein (TIGR01451 family)
VEWLEDRLLLSGGLPAAPNATLSLTLTGANQNLATGSNLAIGELGVETVKIALSPGVVPNAQLAVSLPQGLALARLESLTADPSLSASGGSLTSILNQAKLGPNGSSATLNFGTLTNSDSSSNSASPDVITLVFDVVALNVASNQNGAVANTTANMSFTGGSATASAAATIVTPDLNLAMAVDNATPAPNDAVTFTVVLRHAQDSATAGFNVNLTDALPAGATYVANSLETVAGQAPDVVGFSGGTIAALYDSFPMGATSTLSFQAVVRPSINNPGGATNKASLTYTSLPGLGNPQLSPFNVNSHERTGNPADPGGAVNNLATSASAAYTITQPAPVGISESIVGPGDAFVHSTKVAIGAQVQYRIDLAIPRGSTPAGELLDVFSSGLAVQSLDSLTADPGLVTSSAGGFTGILNTAQRNVGAGGSSLQLNFGTLTNNSSGPADISLTFTAVVLNTAGNQTGTALTNFASFTDSRGSVSTSATPVQVETPVLGINETPSATSGGAGGAPITFTIAVAHTAASAADAFDVAVNDVLPSGFTLVAGSLRSTTGAVPSTLEASGNTITATYDDLALGSSSTISFQAALVATVAPGNVEHSTATVTYTTLTGDVTTPQSPYNGLSTERTGNPADPGGTVNDLSASATVSVTVSGSSLGGNVYVDANNDGVPEQGEVRLGGVTITLSGFDSQGIPVSAVTTTTSAGTYLFTGLRSGTYAITAAQPAGYVAGKDTAGSVGGANPAVNQLTGIVLAPGASGVGYDFSERPTAALTLGTTVDDAAPNVGQNVTYTLTIQNSGPDDAAGVVVAAPLPSGLSFVSDAPSVGTYDSNTGDWTIPALANGAGATLSLTAAVNSAAARTLVATIVASDQAIPPSAGQPASATEMPQAAALALTAQLDQATPTVGDTIHYLATITNNGPDTATGVVFTSVLPSGLQFVSATTTAGLYEPAHGTWSVATLAPGASVGLTVSALVTSHDPQTIDATVRADQHDPAPAGTAATVTVTPQLADLALTSAISNATPNVGATITATVTLTNNGPAAASSILVTAALPAGLTFQSAMPSQGTYESTSGVWTVGGLAVGDSVTLNLLATVASPLPRSINAAIAQTGQFDPVPSNNTATLLETPQQADLMVTETVSDTNPILGNTIQFITTLVNNGPSAATHVAVQTSLPSGLTLVSATASEGTYNAATGSWTVGPVAVAGAPVLVLSARVENPAPASVTATVSASDQFDPDSANNSGTTSESIQVANLQVAETVSDPTPVVGETVTYTVTVRDSGPDSATGVTVAFPLPPGLTFATAVPSQGTYNSTSGIWTIGSFAVGTVPTLTLTAVVATATTETTTATISSVDQFVPNTQAIMQSVTVVPKTQGVSTDFVGITLPFAPVIGTLITGSSGVATASVAGGLASATTSGSGSRSGSGADNGATGPGSLARGQARASGSANGTKVSAHPRPQPRGSSHAAPNPANPEPPLVVILPENALAIHVVAAPPAPVAAHNNANAAVGIQARGALPNQPLAARSAAPTQFSSPAPVQNLNAAFAVNNTGAVGTTMKVITIIQAQRIWSRNSKSHHHGARRRFR